MLTKEQRCADIVLAILKYTLFPKKSLLQDLGLLISQKLSIRKDRLARCDCWSISLFLQIGTLIAYLSDDPREGVKAQVLDDLCHLARERPHLWDTQSVHVSPPPSFFWHRVT